MNLNVMDTGEILAKALAGEKLFPEEAIHLCNAGPLLDLAAAAGELVRRANPDGRVGYVVNKTVVYSNVCQPQCPFCQGTVTREDPRAFTLTAEEVVAAVAGAVAEGATQVILQGGHRIDLDWEYYPGLIRAIKERFPTLQVAAFSPTEIMVLNVAHQKSTAQVVGELKDAGLDAMLAGGAPTLNSRIPEYRALLRGPWSEWFDVVHRCADHGIPMAAPFAFGMGETPRERVGHLYRVRSVQERTAAAGKPVFSTLAVFTLAPGAGETSAAGAAAAAPTSGAAEAACAEAGSTAAAPAQPASGYEYLRMLALARILVPNIPHVQSSFLSQGAKVAQVALDDGADDMGGTYLEYRQAELAAGRVGPMTAAEMERLITDAGRIPVRRSGL